MAQQGLDPQEQVGFWLATACSRHSVQADIRQVLVEHFPTARVLRLSFGLQSKTMVNVNITLPLGTCHVSFIPIHPTAAAASVLQDTPTVVVRQPDKNSPLWDQEDMWQREGCATLTVVSMPFYWPPREGDQLYGHPLPRPMRPEHQPTFGAMSIGSPEPLPEHGVAILLNLAIRTGRHVCPHISALLAALEAHSALPSELASQNELRRDDEGEGTEEDEIDNAELGFDAALQQDMPPDILAPIAAPEPQPPAQQAQHAQQQQQEQQQQQQEQQDVAADVSPVAAGPVQQQQQQQPRAVPQQGTPQGAVLPAPHRAPPPTPRPQGVQFRPPVPPQQQQQQQQQQGAPAAAAVGAAGAAARPHGGEAAAGVEGGGRRGAVEPAAKGGLAGQGPAPLEAAVAAVGGAALDGAVQGEVRSQSYRNAATWVPLQFKGFADEQKERAFLEFQAAALAKLDVVVLFVLTVLAPMLAEVAEADRTYPHRFLALTAGIPLVLLLRYPAIYRTHREVLLMAVGAHGAVCAAYEAPLWMPAQHDGYNMLSLLFRSTGLDYIILAPLMLQVRAFRALHMQAASLAILLPRLAYTLARSAAPPSERPSPSPDTVHLLLLQILLAAGALGAVALLWVRENRLRREFERRGRR